MAFFLRFQYFSFSFIFFAKKIVVNFLAFHRKSLEDNIPLFFLFFFLIILFSFCLRFVIVTSVLGGSCWVSYKIGGQNFLGNSSKRNKVLIESGKCWLLMVIWNDFVFFFLTLFYWNKKSFSIRLFPRPFIFVL